jgi:hypothetical protein
MKAIAKRIPERPLAGKTIEVAEGYGLTREEFRAAQLNFLQNEGYDDMGNEYYTLHDWLTRPHGEFVDRTPYQKGDDWDI